MGELRKLADWWTGDACVQHDLTIAATAPQLADVCNEEASGHGMEPFIEEIDLRVAISLEDCLRTATPLGRHSLLREIGEAIAVYRNTETFAPLNDLAIFMPLITTYRRPSVFINGLNAHQPFSKVWNWLDASPETLEAAFAVLVTTVKLDGTAAVTGLDATDGPVPDHEQQYSLADPKLVELLVVHPESADDIIGIVRVSPGICTDLIRDMLTAEQRALRDGML